MARKAPLEPSQDTPKPQIPNPGIGTPPSPLRKRQRIPEAGNEEKNRDLGKSGKPGSENPKFPLENPKLPLENPKLPLENPKPALIPLEEFLEQEDWLEDDLGRSRKRPRRNFWELRESRDSKIPKLGSSKVASRESQMVANHGKELLEQQEFFGIIPNPSQIPESSGTAPNRPQIPEFAGRIPNPAQIPALRIRIRIQDDVFLIPVVPSPERSVGWLAARAAERFSRNSGMFPKLLLRKFH
ncbi:tonsoku-like protein [Aphelocoma coerulescens]|uniref:tonsoku-like protein n=1 Tax=Aphelocoma coerulescens TaxID=39617 RepID=UPI003604615D